MIDFVKISKTKRFGDVREERVLPTSPIAG